MDQEAFAAIVARVLRQHRDPARSVRTDSYSEAASIALDIYDAILGAGDNREVAYDAGEAFLRATDPYIRRSL